MKEHALTFYLHIKIFIQICEQKIILTISEDFIAYFTVFLIFLSSVYKLSANNFNRKNK